MKKRFRREGFLYLPLLVGLLAASLLAIEAFKAFSQARRLTQMRAARVRALYAAESGLEYATHFFQRSATGGQVPEDGFVLNGAGFRVRFDDLSARLNLRWIFAGDARTRDIAHETAQRIFIDQEQVLADLIDWLETAIEADTAGGYLPLWGWGETAGVFFTGWPTHGVNVNTASARLLAALLELSPDQAQALLRRREKSAFRSIDELKDLLDASQLERSRGLLGFDSQYYGLSCLGQAGGQSVCLRTTLRLGQVEGQPAVERLQTEFVPLGGAQEFSSLERTSL